jgi:hypothetical protein
MATKPVTRNSLAPALELVKQAIEKVTELQRAKVPHLVDAKFVLMDLSEILDVWSRRESPAINPYARQEVAKEFKAAHRLLNAAGVEGEPHGMITRAERAIEVAQQQPPTQPTQSRTETLTTTQTVVRTRRHGAPVAA